MGKCKNCGRETLPEQDYCMQCGPADRKLSKNSIKEVGSPDRIHKRGEFSLKDFVFDSFYEDKNKEIPKSGIFLRTARLAAQIFYNSGMKKTQIRNFYRYIKGLEIPLRLPISPGFAAVVPKLDELYTFTVYQTNREKNPYPKIFKGFYEAHLDLIKSDQREFEGFVKYISSIIAYFTEVEEIELERKRYSRKKIRR